MAARLIAPDEMIDTPNDSRAYQISGIPKNTKPALWDSFCKAADSPPCRRKPFTTTKVARSAPWCHPPKPGRTPETRPQTADPTTDWTTNFPIVRKPQPQDPGVVDSRRAQITAGVVVDGLRSKAENPAWLFSTERSLRFRNKFLLSTSRSSTRHSSGKSTRRTSDILGVHEELKISFIATARLSRHCVHCSNSHPI